MEALVYTFLPKNFVENQKQKFFLMFNIFIKEINKV